MRFLTSARRIVLSQIAAENDTAVWAFDVSAVALRGLSRHNQSSSDSSEGMFSIQNGNSRLCDGLPRRDWLHMGSGAGLTALTAARAATDPAKGVTHPGFGRAKRCIILFLLGGPPQQETWDPKPNAPAEVRGPYGQIASALPGLHVGELMPLTAQRADRVAVLRAMSTDDNAHSASGYWMLTGRPHTPKNKENAGTGPPNDDPCVAAIVRHLKGDLQTLPGSVVLPEEIWNTGHIVWPGQTAGWLGHAADPWLLTCDPNAPDFRVSDITLPSEIPSLRFERRRSLVSQIDSHVGQLDRVNAVGRWSGLQQQALDLMNSGAARSAFAVDQEADTVRNRYGRNRFGQSVLLGRRLLEAGVSLVQVNWTRWEHDTSAAPAWDTHADNAGRLKKDLMPQMDAAYSALLDDLHDRGMLDDTLVVWMGEFGRTPKINGRGGRDHWGHVYSVALAGGGVRPGIVHGTSDSQAAYPVDGRVEPQDLSATLLHCLGFPPSTEIRNPLGRPFPISTGRPIEAIL